MNKEIWKEIKGKVGIKVARTLLVNTAITLFMFYLILNKRDFEDLYYVFIISLVVLLCSYTFSNVALNFITEKPNRKRIILIVSLIITGSLSGSFLGCVFYYFSNGADAARILKMIFLYSFVFGTIFELGFLYYRHSKKKIEDSEKKIHEEKIKRLTLEKETAMTTMKLMQAQIEPHFLFNTLSNIVSLFDIELETAKKMLMNLNEYLRISLQRTRQEMIALDQELELIGRYLDIYKFRMGKRLTYEIEKKGSCLHIPFPPMVIQPLVENAIKHGLEPKKEGGFIKIECAAERNCLRIAVSDSGLGMGETSDTTGIGLNNISRRLNSIYGDHARLIVKENKPCGVTAIVEVPL